MSSRWPARVCLAVVGVGFAFAATAGSTVRAQSPHPSSSQEVEQQAAGARTWHVGPLFGIARNSPAALFLGVTPGRDHLFVGVQAATPLRRVRRATLTYVVQVLPVVSISGRTAPIDYTGSLAPDGFLPAAERTYAFGFSPLGFELSTPERKRLSLFGGIAGGVLLFPRPFPVAEADRLNFTLEIGGGTRVRTGPSQWLQLGYKLHHLSNAYRAEMNPGLDGHVFHAGYAWSTRFGR